MRKLILISLKNSLKLVTIYPIHTVMTFIYALLNIVLNLVFWLVLSSNFGEIGLYGIKEIMVLNMFALLADSLGGFFFGYIDLPYCINDGSYDKYNIGAWYDEADKQKFMDEEKFKATSIREIKDELRKYG